MTVYHSAPICPLSFLLYTPALSNYFFYFLTFITNVKIILFKLNKIIQKGYQTYRRLLKLLVIGYVY